MVSVYSLPVVQERFAFPHQDKAAAVFNADELFDMIVHFQSDLPANGDAHERHLKVTARP